MQVQLKVLDNIWQNNGPQVADSIKQAAGLQAPYKYLLLEKAPAHQSQPINQYNGNGS
ncbi:hypothetical protein SAMN05216311_105412 [Chitinophaga sp. CF418]|nr:hypothetical protein SAMN05216311_105412 [Chitinophaga sp. CF418]